MRCRLLTMQSKKKNLQSKLGEHVIEKLLLQVLAQECQKRSKPGEVFEDFTGKIDGRQSNEKKALMRSVTNASKATGRTELNVLAKSDIDPEDLELAICTALYGRIPNSDDQLYHQLMGLLASANFENKKDTQDMLKRAQRIAPAVAERMENAIAEAEIVYKTKTDMAVRVLLEGFVWWIQKTNNKYMFMKGQAPETVFHAAIAEYYNWMGGKIVHEHVVKMFKKLTEFEYGVRANSDWDVQWSDVEK